MAGTKLGGQHAAATNKSRYGDDFYRKLGSKSWIRRKQVPVEERTPWGFRAMDKEKVRLAGSKGGRASRRGKSAKNSVKNQETTQETQE